MLKNLQSTLPLWVDNRFYIRELTTYLHFISPFWVDSLSLSLNLIRLTKLSAAKMSCWKLIFPQSELTFPCFYSKANPWIVLSHYDRSQNTTCKHLPCIQSSSILKSTFIYNISLLSENTLKYPKLSAAILIPLHQRVLWRTETMDAILYSILIPNLLFVVSVVILVYWLDCYDLSDLVVCYCCKKIQPVLKCA